MLKSTVLTTIAILMIATSLIGQRDIQVTLPFHLHIGATLAKEEEDSLPDWGQNVGSSFVFQAGIGFKYKQAYGIDLLGQFNLTNYNFLSGDSTYSVSNFAKGLGIFPYFNIPLKKEKKSFLQVGCSMGQLYQTADQLRKSEYDMLFSTSSTTHTRPYFIPSISITGFRPRSSFSVGINYAIFENQQPLLRTYMLKSNGKKDAYSGSGDYLGLQLRYSLTIAGHAEPKHKTVAPLENAEIYYQRDYKIEKEFSTPSKNVIITVFDNGEMDNDTISVMVNGEYILTHFELTKAKKRIKLRLHEGENEIIFLAENEGRVPPNTATCELKSRFRKTAILVTTEDFQNVSIPIWVGPNGHVQNE